MKTAWSRWILAVLLAWSAGRARAAEAPEQMVIDGAPPLDPALRTEVARYLEFRASLFQDWHPVRRDVLITTRFGETAQLHLVQQPEGARRQLTFLREPVASGSFQPGAGDSIVFSQDAGGSEFFQLYRYDPEDGRVALLTDGKSRNTGPRWSRSGQWLAYTTTRRNGRDTDIHRLQPGVPGSDRPVALLEGGGWSILDWSPDDTQLLVLNYVSINESSLHVVEVASGRMRRVTPEGERGVAYAGGQFGRDGRTVWTTTDRGTEFRRLVRLDPATGALTPVGDAEAGDVEAFDLSPDGKHLAWFVNEQGVSRLHVADADRGRERSVPPLPMGVATGLRWHPRGRELGFSLSSARSPNDVYSVDTRVRTLTRWTVSETGGLNPARFAEPELVKVRSFDGLEVSGFLYRPNPGRHPGPRPVLISIHGGPEAQSRPGFQMRWNYLIEELGMAILYPNVRGSAGYGKTFLTLDNGMKREDSVRDVGAFLDWIATQPGLDAKRVGVYGGSYGGYMVLASLVHHGERLKCGVDVVGISSFLTFLRNTQDYRRDLRRVEYGDERDPAMAAHLEKISPLGQAHRIRRPLLVAQGLNDPRVPVGEAEQMVKAVRGQGGEVWYLLARDEGHGFAKKKNIDHLFLTLAQFLRQHLAQ